MKYLSLILLLSSTVHAEKVKTSELILRSLLRVEHLLEVQTRRTDQLERESKQAQQCQDHCLEIPNDEKDTRGACFESCRKTTPWPAMVGGGC